MKTAISLPDELFEAVERIVKQSGRTRSEVYSLALKEYVARHTPDDITAGWNRVIEQVSDVTGEETFRKKAARSTLGRAEW
jgi:metal-responsive CopG/Arc/MetJ family transcriptional regulator